MLLQLVAVFIRTLIEIHNCNLLAINKLWIRNKLACSSKLIILFFFKDMSAIQWFLLSTSHMLTPFSILAFSRVHYSKVGTVPPRKLNKNELAKVIAKTVLYRTFLFFKSLYYYFVAQRSNKSIQRFYHIPIKQEWHTDTEVAFTVASIDCMAKFILRPSDTKSRNIRKNANTRIQCYIAIIEV